MILESPLANLASTYLFVYFFSYFKFYVYDFFCLCVYLHTHVCLVLLEGQKMVSDPLELELQMTVTCSI